MELYRLNEIEQRMSDDFDWALHALEVQQNPEHFGKLVVVYNKRVLASGRDRQALVEQAAKQLGVPWYDLVVVVVASPEMWEIPH
ncbi:MAG: hypothetical protein ACRELG_22720 [Gemmataceae bacterium]